VVCKLAGGVSTATAALRDWLKVKCLTGQEFVVGGFTDPAGSRVGLGALCWASTKMGGWSTPDKVGSGLQAARSARAAPAALRVGCREATFAQTGAAHRSRGAHWVKPTMVVRSASAADLGRRLRHPSSWASVKTNSEGTIVREVVAPAGKMTWMTAAAERAIRCEKGEPAARRGVVPGALGTAATLGPRQYPIAGEVEVAGVRISQRTGSVFSESGITKLEVAEYYALVWPLMQPHVTGRPLTLVRCPDGSDGSCFYQKHIGGRVRPATCAGRRSGKAAGRRPIRPSTRSPGCWIWCRWALSRSTPGGRLIASVGAARHHGL